MGLVTDREPLIESATSATPNLGCDVVVPDPDQRCKCNEIIAEPSNGNEIWDEIRWHQQVAEGRDHRHPNRCRSGGIEDQFQGFEGRCSKRAACPPQQRLKNMLIDHFTVENRGINGGISRC